ncbi:MAG: hypothetical protein LBD44_00985 [Spirochaetaceae bacterium]|jgi:hypothetical protein|nr:hypothetical protein [Spirochaetaceae bacterium]
MENQRDRASLIKEIEAELKKDSACIDGDLIDGRLDKLYALDGLAAPKLDDKALDAATRTVRARAAWRRGNKLAKRVRKRQFTRRAVCGVWAACFAVLFLFSANYVTTLVTGSCLPSKVGIKLCCGTRYCLCGTTGAEADHLNDHAP